MTFPSYLYVPVPYMGSLFSVPIALASTQATTNNTGTITKQGHQSKALTTQYDWLNIYPGNAVAVNLQSQGTTQPLDKILMVYVDNTNNGGSLSILFPDTQQVIGVPAHSSGWYPVMTSGFFCNVYNITTPSTDVLAQSTIIFCNFAIPSFEATEFVNSLQFVQISDDALGRKYVIPAAGDKYANLTLQLVGSNSIGTQDNVLPLVAAPLYYVVTSIVMQLFQCSASLGQGSQQIEITLFDDSAFATLREQFVFVHPDVSQDSYKIQTILEESGLYLICQELSLYAVITPGTVSVGLSTGYVQINISYALLSPTSPTI